MRRIWALLAVAVLLSTAVPVQAPKLDASEPVTVTALAVAQTDGGFRGVSASVHATVVANGSGQVFVSTKPLAQTDMQGSARLAARVAAQTLGLDWRSYDYFIVFESESVVIGGPSAGGTMTLAVATALNNLAHPDRTWSLNPNVAMTGTINPDGTIGPVGGIPTKAQAAADRGIDLFLFPSGQERAVRVGPDGGRSVVHVPTYCRDQLQISCKPVATSREVIRNAANVEIEQPDIPEPSTRGYADVLEPRVAPKVDALGARVDAAWQALNASGLDAAERRQVETSLQRAQERLGRAADALDAGRYYTTATMAFQGNIWAGHAENLTELLVRDGSAQVVEAAIATCQGAVDDARSFAYGLNASGLHGLLAIGAAQKRVAQAEDLLNSARSRYRNGVTADDWSQALHDASFCTERAGTVVWWGNLRDAFGPGPTVQDPRGMARQVVELARERVFYAQAVLRGQGDLSGAQNLLQRAQTAIDAGRYPEAVVTGAEAQAEASIAVQAAGGAVSGEVVQAARDAVSRTIAEARAQGFEPITSVALFELSQDVEGNRTALTFLWSARSLAALQASPSPGPVSYTFVGPPPELQTTVRSTSFLWLGVATGALAGGLVVGLAAVLAMGLGKRR